MALRTVVFASMFAAFSAFPAAAACSALTDVVNKMNAGDEAGAQAIAAANVADSCSPDEMAIIDRVAALTSFNRIVGAVGQGKKLIEFDGELETLQKTVAAPWQVLDALGDINREKKNYESAAQYYQLALEDASNETLTPDWMAPDADYIRRLDHLAGEMRLVAAKPIKLAMRGPCKVNYRGVSLKKKSTPVRYVFGTAEFTPEGLQSAKDVSECLKSVNPSSITLIGHTDPVGSPEANRILSLERADALGHYLVSAGYKGKWKSVGLGEDEPFKPDDASAYDEATLHQLNRRVEIDVEK
jgi:OOP family OmpA-OmpF porin